MYKCIFCNKLTNDSERDHWCKEKKKAYADVESTVDPVEKPPHNPPQSDESAQVEKAGEGSGQPKNTVTTDTRESERKTLQQWRERNRERYNETMRQWREDNREKVRAYQREYMRQRRNK